MKHVKPAYVSEFYCRGSQCAAPCAAPVDMTWTQTLGDFCETGISMGCPAGADQILLRREKTLFLEERDNSPAASETALTPSQLALLLDARKTMDIILQNRSLPLRTDVVLSLIYGAAFDPMIATEARYAYEELDWGFTEQPYRQVQAVVQLQGGWETKMSDQRNILGHLARLCCSDSVLKTHLEQTLRLFERLSGEEYRALRSRFDAEMQPREYLFEQLSVYLVHRYFLAHAAEKTVQPCLKLLAVSFAVLRAMSVRLWQETGTLTDSAYSALCCHYARCIEDADVQKELLSAFETKPFYGTENLQRLLWN